MKRYRDLEDFQADLDQESIADETYAEFDEEDIEIMAGKSCNYTTKPAAKTRKVSPMTMPKKGK